MDDMVELLGGVETYSGSGEVAASWDRFNCCQYKSLLKLPT
jgi:hypothetical protein